AMTLSCALLSWQAFGQQSEAFGLGGSLGAAIDRGGFQVGITARHGFNARLSGGATVEWSPWFDLLTRAFTVGTVNGYLTLAVKWVTAQKVALRSALHLGASVLLF